MVLEIDDRGTRTSEGLEKPILDKLQGESAKKTANREGGNPELAAGDLALKTELKNQDAGIQTLKFDGPKTARHIALEIHSSYDAPYSHAAELDVLDLDGNPLKKKNWKIWFANSEETKKNNGRAENMIDGKTSTFWHAIWSSKPTKFPHIVVIDMSTIEDISGIRITPRDGIGGTKGGIKGLKIYARPQFFLNKQ